MSAGQFLVAGLPGKVLEAETAEILGSVQPGGIILLPKNIEDAKQLTTLMGALRELLPEALFYLDAEGGRVDRLRRVVGPAPGGSALAAQPPAFAKRAGRWIGGALASYGFDVDFAPVVDLDHGRASNALDGRYLGRGAAEVERRAREFLAGLETAGVGGCLKHFPGLGRAGDDTHHRGTVIEVENAAALAEDLRPFVRLGALAGAIMVNHASYPGLDPSGRPASLSAVVTTNLLRRQCAYRGLVFSDDLDMDALAPFGNPAERAELAFAAGCDVVCLCHSLDHLAEAEQRLSRPALLVRREESGRRLWSYRRRLAGVRRWARQAGLEAIRHGLQQLMTEAARGEPG